MRLFPMKKARLAGLLFALRDHDAKPSCLKATTAKYAMTGERTIAFINAGVERMNL